MSLEWVGGSDGLYRHYARLLLRYSIINSRLLLLFTVKFIDYIWFTSESYSPLLSICPHLFRGVGHEKRRGEQLKWSLACSLYIGSFPCAHCTATRTSSYSLVGPSVFFCVFSLGLYFVYSFVVLWFVCVSPSFCVSLGSWIISLTVFSISVTNLNEPPRALAASTIAWVRSQLHPFWAVVSKSNAG